MKNENVKNVKNIKNIIEELKEQVLSLEERNEYLEVECEDLTFENISLTGMISELRREYK